MYSDRTEALVTLYRLTQNLSLVVDAIVAMEPSPLEQYDRMSKFGRRVEVHKVYQEARK
jgi:hypothetical protein